MRNDLRKYIQTWAHWLTHRKSSTKNGYCHRLSTKQDSSGWEKKNNRTSGAHLWITVVFPRFAVTRPPRNCQMFMFPTEWMHSKHISVFLSFFMFFSPDYKTELSFFLKKVENFQPLQKKKSLVFPSARNRHCSQFSFYFLFPMHTNVSECTYRYWQCAKYISLYTNYVEQKVFFFFFGFLSHVKLVHFSQLVP